MQTSAGSRAVRRGLSAFAPSFAKKRARGDWRWGQLQAARPGEHFANSLAAGERRPARCTSIATSSTDTSSQLTLKSAIHPGVYNCGRDSLSPPPPRAPCAAGTKINARRRSDQFRITALCGSRSLFHHTLSFSLYRADFRQLVRQAHMCFSRSHFEPLSPFD